MMAERLKTINFKWNEEETTGEGDNVKVEIVEKTYGPIVLKKWNYKEECDLKGKILKVEMKDLGGGRVQEINSVDSGAIFFWTVVYSIKSLPKYPDFWQLSEEKKADIVSYFGCGDDEPDKLGEKILIEARKLNKYEVDPQELKKKSD